ncbi:MAG: hypothetical protein D3924_13555 [Candidatus Electrothrix sp. AR4]|nr:hypothetical protein [Candidatus Electrothrix sp. AR4]
MHWYTLFLSKKVCGQQFLVTAQQQIKKMDFSQNLPINKASSLLLSGKETSCKKLISVFQ